MGGFTNVSFLNRYREDAADGAHGLSSLFEKTRRANRLQMSLQSKHIHFSYLKILNECPVEAWTLQLPHDNQDSTSSAD